MRLLLDTHMLLWALTGDELLPAGARTLIADPENPLFVSAASIWEIAIKHRLQRGSPNDMPISGAEALDHCRRAGYAILPITGVHAAAVDALPLHHADPFDRMLVAQAISEPLRLITHDARLAAYGNMVLLA